MNSLKMRKKLLIAESQINRLQLSGHVAASKNGAGRLIHRADSLALIVSSAVALAKGVAAFQRGGPVVVVSKSKLTPKPSRLQAVLNGAVLISTLGLAFCCPTRDDSDK